MEATFVICFSLQTLPSMIRPAFERFTDYLVNIFLKILPISMDNSAHLAQVIFDTLHTCLQQLPTGFWASTELPLFLEQI